MRFILLFLIFSCTCLAQRYKTPASYLKFIDTQNEQVVLQTWDYMTVFTNNPNSPQAKGQLKVLENTLLKTIRYVEKDNPFDMQLQQDALIYLTGNLAIVQRDYAALLNYDKTNEVIVDRYRIFKEIRNKMYALRTNYDAAVRNYASKHKLSVIENTSRVALQMEQTIKLYDHYYDVRLLLEKLKQADAALWENLPDVSPDAFNTKLDQFNRVVAANQILLNDLVPFNNDTMLLSVYNTSQEKLTATITAHAQDIKAVLVAYESGNRANLSAKTDAYNKAKTQLNIARSETFNGFNKASKLYLQKHLNGF